MHADDRRSGRPGRREGDRPAWSSSHLGAAGASARRSAADLPGRPGSAAGAEHAPGPGRGADMLACLVGHGPSPVPFQNHDTSHVIIASRRRSRPGCPQRGHGRPRRPRAAGTVGGNERRGSVPVRSAGSRVSGAGTGRSGGGRPARAAGRNNRIGKVRAAHLLADAAGADPLTGPPDHGPRRLQGRGRLRPARRAAPHGRGPHRPGPGRYRAGAVLLGDRGAPTREDPGRARRQGHLLPATASRCPPPGRGGRRVRHPGRRARRGPGVVGAHRRSGTQSGDPPHSGHAAPSGHRLPRDPGQHLLAGVSTGSRCRRLQGRLGTRWRRQAQPPSWASPHRRYRRIRQRIRGRPTGPRQRGR